MNKAGLNQSQIADEVDVHKSTISREFRRNKGRRGWHPKQAQELRDEHRKNCANAQRHSFLEWTEAERLIRQDMSPEQASQRLALEGRLSISHDRSTCTFCRQAPEWRPVAALALPEAAQEALCERSRTPRYDQEPDRH
ncbi:MAG: helix-turn-helix domain-containing protein [Nitrosomonas sp.]